MPGNYATNIGLPPQVFPQKTGMLAPAQTPQLPVWEVAGPPEMTTKYIIKHLPSLFSINHNT